MDANYVDVRSEFVNDYMNCYMNKRKLLKIYNTIVLLESKYLNAKASIKRTINCIKDELMGELDVTYQSKLQFLLDFQRKVGEYLSNLINLCSNYHRLRDISRLAENSPNKVRLLPYIPLDFIPEDISIAKSAIGYLKTCTYLPEELTLTTSEVDKYWLETRNGKPWHSLLIYSLTAFAENFAGRKFYGNVIDRKNGFYLITLYNNFGIDYKVSVYLYGHHVRNSPLIIKVPPLRSDEYGSCYLENARVETSTLKTVEIPNQNESIPKLLSDDGICSSFNTDNTSSFLKSEWDKSTRNANRMDNLKIGATGGDGFWSPQTDENLNGSIRGDSTRARKSSKYSDDDDEEKIVPVTAKLTHVISKQCGVDLKHPIGVAVTNNKDIVICDTGNHRVWIVDETGKRKAIFNTTDQGRSLRRPSAVVILGNGDLVIKDNNSLHFYDSNGIFIKSIGNRILNRPFGLVLTENEKLVTLCESRQPKLFVFNNDGHLENKSFYQPLLNRPENSKCRFMATYNNELVVSDLGLSTMYKTNLLGEQIQVFGSYGRTPGNFNEPSGIALDSHGTMLIGDSRNDRIQIFDWDGEYLDVVRFLEPIRRPSDITLTSDGYLYVLNYLDHFLGIYKLEMDEE
ncbi:tripartite motif-containing protein 2-like [Centruroides vittatus]|uniref:tripartite motif-containing protein 2-like n=1 Tax=Centruroides vittatus TaxID=120091 RepID=UPI00350F9BF1